MLTLRTFRGELEPCEYLPGRPSRMDFALANALSPEAYQACMDAGFRMFGRVLFRPSCPSCHACRPIRIPTATFAPSRSQRRALARCADLALTIGAPTVDEERVALFNRYHAARVEKRGWSTHARDIEGYRQAFLDGSFPRQEISLREDGALRAVALVDIAADAISGAYHYHDPDQAERGLGTGVMLEVIRLAQRLGKPFAYFGFYVADCASLNYKARFQPCELLGTDGIWRPFVQDG